MQKKKTENFYLKFSDDTRRRTIFLQEDYIFAQKWGRLRFEELRTLLVLNNFLGQQTSDFLPTYANGDTIFL